MRTNSKLEDGVALSTYVINLIQKNRLCSVASVVCSFLAAFKPCHRHEVVLACEH